MAARWDRARAATRAGAGNRRQAHLFGADPQRRPIEVRDFFIGTTPVAQALWLQVMGANPSVGDIETFDDASGSVIGDRGSHKPQSPFL
jgi:formylglycine-generating enzyme required for sulfatase activity